MCVKGIIQSYSHVAKFYFILETNPARTNTLAGGGSYYKTDLQKITRIVSIMNDNDILKFFQGFKYRESKELVLNLYIQGKISKEEFLKRMENAKGK